jgi:hypothetical protein
MGSLNGDYECKLNNEAHRIRKDVNGLFGWWAESWTKNWPTVSKLEMPDTPYFNVQKGI